MMQGTWSPLSYVEVDSIVGSLQILVSDTGMLIMIFFQKSIIVLKKSIFSIIIFVSRSQY